MKIGAINGSPRGDKSNSMEIISVIKSFLPENSEWHIVSQIGLHSDSEKKTVSMEKLFICDVLFLAFPLYVDSLPASLMYCLEEYEKNYRGWSSKQETRPVQRVFAVSNCGFYEGFQNDTALKMIELFCESAGLKWCGGAGIGTGEMVRGLANVPPEAFIRKPVTRALEKIADSIADPEGKLEKNIFTQHNFPWILYKLAAEWGWRHEVRKNRLRRKDLDAKPLLNLTAG